MANYNFWANIFLKITNLIKLKKINEVIAQVRDIILLTKQVVNIVEQYKN